ncbi:MAG TPA: Uma2 family endonuclease [Planctomycetota bacterium]
MAPSGPLITAEELIRHPEWDPCELVDGRLVPTNYHGMEGGAIATDILCALGSHARESDLGYVRPAPTGIILSHNPDTVRVPDVMFIRKERLPQGVGDEFLPVPPDIAVEVAGFLDKLNDVMKKAESYVAAGVKLVWVIDPDSRKAYVFRPGQSISELNETQALSGENVLPGFTLALSELFV